MDEKTNLIITKTNRQENQEDNIKVNNDDSFHGANFEKFLKYFRHKNLFSGASWNKHREEHYKDQQNRRKIILKEIDQLDAKDPLNIINEDYLKDQYSQHLLSNELKKFENLLKDDINLRLLDKRENLEMIKKIIEYYLNYVVELNFDSIMKSLKKMNLIESNILFSLSKITNLKNKIMSIKQHLLINSAKLLLYKNKIKNLQKMQLLLKDYIFYWAMLFKSMKELKKDDNIGLIYDILIHINRGIKNFFNNNQLNEIFFNSNKKNNQDVINHKNGMNSTNNKSEFKKKTIKVVDILYEKCEKKLNKINTNFAKNFLNLFQQQKINYLNFFYYQLSVNKGDISNFTRIFTMNFKINIIDCIKNSLASFADENRAYAIREIVRLRDLSTVKFEENRLTQAINKMLNGLDDIVANFEFYISLHEKLQEDSNYLNFFKHQLERLEEERKFQEIKRKKIETFAINNELINIFKIYENKEFSDILSLKIKYFNNINKYIRQSNPKFLHSIKEKFDFFFNLIEKKAAKILVVYKHIFKEMNIKNLICVMIYYDIFLKKTQHYFKADFSRHIKKHMNEIILDNLKFNNLQNIRKIGILLSGDNWKRVALQDDHEFISQNKLEEKLPICLSGLLSSFKIDINDIPKFINVDNLNSIYKSLTNSINFNSNQNFPKYSFMDNYDPEFFTRFKNFDIIHKKLNNKNLIISSSSTTLIRGLIDFVIFIIFFDNLTYDVFLQIFNLFDYFIVATLFMFTDKKIISCLYEELNVEEIRKKNKLDYGIEMVLFQKRYQNLRRFINQSRRNFENLYEKSIDFLKFSYDTESYENNEFHLPKLNSEINLLDNNIYSGMIENIILFESIHSIYKIIKRLKHYTKNIQFELGKMEIEKKFLNYKLIINEIKMFFYKPICNNIFKVDSIMNKIINFKWDLKDQESDSQFNEASPFIDNIFQEICEKYDKLFLLSAGSLTQKSQNRFLEVILAYFAEKLMDNFSKIKKCTSCGRSIMLKDIKFFKSKIEAKFSFECQNFFSDLEIFVNSWYNDENDFVKFINESHINYKYMTGIFNTAQNVVKMSKQTRKDFNQKIEDTYYQMIDTIKSNILLD